jgi:hypothetical protein
MNHQEINHIIKTLRENLIIFRDITSFSKNPGIYAIGFDGDRFPLISAKDSITSGDIIYIGKSESSQVKRDVKTHFQPGMTGSSTVRRSIGAILREDLDLVPMPRSFTETSGKRFTSYCFNEKGEEVLTNWMKKNLSLSFWDYHGLKDDLESIEIVVIQKLEPIINLKNNPRNQWKKEIMDFRKMCSKMAKDRYA